MVILPVLVLHQLFNAVYFNLADVDLVLEGGKLHFGFLVSLFLRGSDTIELHAHVFNLLGLRVVDISLPGDVLVALFNLELRGFILLGDIPLRFLRLSQLDLDVAQRVLQFFVFNLAQAQHLAVFHLRALLVLHSQAASHDAIVLKSKKLASRLSMEMYLL